MSEPSWRILEGDCLPQLATLEPASVQTCVTSPPYFGLRDYGHDGQIGLEPTPDDFVAAMVEVFREVRRVLRDDGTVWLNLGDSYAGAGPSGALYQSNTTKRRAEMKASGASHDGAFCIGGDPSAAQPGYVHKKPVAPEGWKPKDLLGIPWMVAFALRADGWYLRSDIIWAKPNPMPESVTDRPTKAHEYLFLLSKSPRYFYDADAVREAHTTGERNGERISYPAGSASSHHIEDGHRVGRHGPGLPLNEAGRNKRSVWTVATQPFPGAHFATFPPKLIEPCILAGSAEGDTVLDPFAGAGTTGMVALRHGRSFVGCELNPDYVRLARDRIIADSPLLNTHALFDKDAA